MSSVMFCMLFFVCVCVLVHAVCVHARMRARARVCVQILTKWGPIYSK